MTIPMRLNLDDLADVTRPVVTVKGNDYRIKVIEDLSPNDLARLSVLGNDLSDMPEPADADGFAVWRANISDAVKTLFYDDVGSVDFGSLTVSQVIGLCHFFTDTLTPGNPPNPEPPE